MFIKTICGYPLVQEFSGFSCYIFLCHLFKKMRTYFIIRKYSSFTKIYRKSYSKHFKYTVSLKQKQSKVSSVLSFILESEDLGLNLSKWQTIYHLRSKFLHLWMGILEIFRGEDLLALITCDYNVQDLLPFILNP